MKNQRVFDCFTFLNEFDLLEIRLNHLSPVVDIFVISQALYTHRGKSWDPLLSNESPLIEEFRNRAEFRFVTQSIPYNEMWEREKAQRIELDKALSDVNANDLIIISDLDEMPDLDQIKKAKGLKTVHHSLPMRTYFNFANTHNNGFWDHAKICSGQSFPGAQKLREESLLPRIRPAGAHLSVIQGERRWLEKIGITPHTEMGDGMSGETIRKCLRLNLYPNTKILKLWGGGKLEVNYNITDSSAINIIEKKFPEYLYKGDSQPLTPRIKLIVELYKNTSLYRENAFTKRIAKTAPSFYTAYCYLVYSAYFPYRAWSLVYRKAKIRTRLRKVINYFE
jgi:hypothetical protein